MKNRTYAWCTFILHLFFFLSIFDIYLTSPVIVGLTPLPKHSLPPAKRVVVVSIDGTRYSTFTSTDKTGHPRAAYVLSRICSNGLFGRSITQLPTESRPGHVAIFGGLGEDLSNVAAGWKKSLVPFDTVFNQSQSSFLFGSPDIVDIFMNGRDNVAGFAYDAAFEDFSKDNADYLDTWVLDRAERFFAERQKSVDGGNGEVYFFHLLGSDTNGHVHKPSSFQYQNNVNVVDAIIAKLEALINAHFDHDNATAWIVTADHGMTDWGSHGAGSPDEIVTPLAAWGAGIASSLDGTACSFDHFKQLEINQIDLAPLISSLISIPIPSNSIGSFHPSMIDSTSENRLLMMRENIEQLLNQLDAMEQRSFRTYRDSVDQFKVRMYQADFDALKKVEADVKKGIRFYHVANRPILSLLVVGGVLSWMVYTMVLVVAPSSSSTRSLRHSRLFIATGLILSSVLVMMLKLKTYQIVWFIFAVLPMSLLIKCRLPSLDYGALGQMALFSQLLVAVFFHRQVLSFVIIVFILTPRLNGNVANVAKLENMATLALALFPLLPTISDTENRALVLITEFIGIVIFQVKYYSQLESSRLLSINLWCTFMIKTLMAMSQLFSLEPPSIVIYASWMCLVITFITPFYESPVIEKRFLAIAFSLFSLYSLFSTFYENVFMLVFIFNLFFFIKSESKSRSQSTCYNYSGSIFDEGIGTLKMGTDVARVEVFLVYILVAFFGVGNIASLNSFNPTSIESFVFIFNPFIMGILLFFKVILPFIPTCCALLAIIRTENICYSSLMKLIILISDMMSLTFFFLVRDEGSWLDVGLSISNFSIVLLMNISITLVMMLSSLLATTTLRAKLAN